YWMLFFSSSRRRHTRSKRDWSSDVCSSDLGLTLLHLVADLDKGRLVGCRRHVKGAHHRGGDALAFRRGGGGRRGRGRSGGGGSRSEERRVGNGSRRNRKASTSSRTQTQTDT